MSREVFESLIKQEVNKKYGTEAYAVKRKDLGEGIYGDYVKPETRLAWKWYREGLNQR